MAASIALSASTVARGSGDAMTGSGFSPGRAVNFYVNGQYAGTRAVGPHDTIAYGSMASILGIPDSSRITYTGSAPVIAVDNTDGTSATTTVTLT